MSDTDPLSNPVSEVKVFDLSSYIQVLVHTTAEVDGHEYRRGTYYHVDDATFTSMKAAHIIVEDLK